MSASSVAYEYCQRLIHRFAENRKTLTNQFKRSNRHQADNAMVEALENRILLSGSDVAVAYVDDDWAALTVGVDPDGDGPAGEIGVDAFASIQDAIDNLAENGTIHVADGTYTENLSITQNLTLLSDNGRDVTFINGISGVGASGAITISNATTGVNIGEYHQGFTILGIDNGNPAIENATIYLEGSHSGLNITSNEIIANGEAGLLSEWSAAITSTTIWDNIFSGQTFIGDTPAGDGFSQQFSLDNVPRQLVSFGGGTTSNNSLISFLANQITGTTGGINSEGIEQSNNLVTIDAQNSTISGNTFNGTATSGAYALRVRGSGQSTIIDNYFYSDNMGVHTGHVIALIPKVSSQLSNFGQILNHLNNFDGGAYIAELPAVMVGIEDLVELAPSGSTVNILAGTYTADMTITNDNITIQGPYSNYYPSNPSRVNEAIITGGFRVQGDSVTITGLTILDGVGPAGIGDITAIHMASDTTGHLIKNNIITGADASGSRGIVSSSPSGTFNVINNDFSGWTTGLYINPGSNNVFVDANNFHDNVVGLSADDATKLIVENSFFTNNSFEHIGLGGGNGVIIRENSFDANSPSVSNYGTLNVNASNNWWGTTDLALITSNLTANASGPIDYSPYFNSDRDTLLGRYGFQPDYASMTAHTSGSQTTYIIEEIVENTNTNGTVILEGDYTGDYTVGDGITIGGQFTLDGELALIDGASLAPGNSPAIVNLGGLTMGTGETLAIELFGTTPGTEHDQVNVTGIVDITDATLDTTLGYYPATSGDSFTIINNDDVDAIVGTFAGLAEGATFTMSYGGVDFDASITYIGGDGNDVVITTDAYAVTDVYVDDDWAGLSVGDDPDGVGPLQGIGFDAFANIQDAIDAVDAGGNVHIAAGDYDQGTINLNKDGVALLGAQVGVNASSRDNVDVTDEAVIHGTIVVGHNITGATIDGLFMQDFTNSSAEYFGVFVSGGADQTTVQNVYFQGTAPDVLQNGIVTSIAGTTNNVFTQNVYDSTYYGVYLNPNSVGNEITDSLITNTRIGYVIDTAENTTVTGNTFDNSTGIYFWDGGTASVGDNTGVSIENNTFQNGTGIRDSYVTVNDPGLTVDLSNNTFDGKLPSAMSLTELFDLEDKITHAIDDAAYGSLGIVVADNLYVTQLSSSIQNGIDAATAGDTLHVQAGTFTENLTVDKTLQIIGAGSGSTILEAGNAVGINVTAGGTSAAEADRLLISGMAINNEASMGIVIDGTVSYITIEDVDVNVDGVKRTDYGLEVAATADVTDLLIDNSSFSTNSEGAGMHVHGSVDGLSITDSHFDGNNIGFYAFQVDGSDTILDNVNISDSSFNNNTYKGLYIEKLSNALLDNITVNNSGTLSGTADGLAGYEVWPTGIDLNLKYYDYTNITIQNSTVTDSGSANPANGAGLAVKTRDDGSYATHPATLNGITITGMVINGAQTAVRFGEPGKNNTGLSNVLFTGNDLSGSLTGLAYDNQSVDLIYISGNYWGTISRMGYDSVPSIFDRINGPFSFSNWANADLTQLFAIPDVTYVSSSNGGLSEEAPGVSGGIYGYTAFSSISDAEKNTTSSAGVIEVAYGVYTENVRVGVNRILTGNFTINGSLEFYGTGTLAPGNSPGIINTGDLTMASGSTLEIEIQGATAGTGYDQVNVTGTVDIDGVILDTTFGYFPSHAGDSFTIINNDASDAIVGTFDGLAEGASLTLSHGGADFNATISYVGGDGNDVVITTDPYTLDTVYVDDDWAGLVIGDDPDGAGPLVSFGYDAFDNINDAMDAVTNGGTIHVFDGTYTESVSIIKSVNLLGANENVDPTNSGVRNSESTIIGNVHIVSDDVVFNGFELTGYNYNGLTIAGQVSNIVISNNYVHDSIGGNSAILLAPDAGDTPNGEVVALTNIDILNNYVVTNSSINNQVGIRFSGPAYTHDVQYNQVTLDGNEVTGTGVGHYGIFSGSNPGGYSLQDAVITNNYIHDVASGINLGNMFNGLVDNNIIDGTSGTGASLGVIDGTISNNTFLNIGSQLASGGTAALGIWGTEYGFTATTNATITGNVFNFNDNANATISGVYTREGADSDNIHINENSFVNGNAGTDAFAVANWSEDGGMLDASNNWWSTTDASEVAALASDSYEEETTPGVFETFTSGDVDTSPFLESGTDADGSTAGFQGDFSSLTVHDEGAQTINLLYEGITQVDVDGTVHVEAGTYDTTSLDPIYGVYPVNYLTIDKSVNLLGANAGINPNTESRGDETSIIGSIVVDADNVTIDGFELTGGTDAYLNTDVIGKLLIEAGVSGTTLENLSIHDVNFDSAPYGFAEVVILGSNANTLIEDNDIQGHVFFYNNSNATSGVDTWSDTLIQNNTIDAISSSNRYGAYSWHYEFDNLDILNNVIGSISLRSLNDALIDNNSFTDAVAVTGSGTISRNDFTEGSTLTLGLDDNIKQNAGAAFDITNNFFTYNTNPDVAETATIYVKREAGAGNIHINGNSFTNGYARNDANAVINGDAYGGVLDLSSNYWGTTDLNTIIELTYNPTVIEDEPGVFITLAQGLVDTSPYLFRPNDMDTNTPGFQGDFARLYVHAQSAQTTENINEALGVFDTTDTQNWMEIINGNYTEDVIVDIPANVRGEFVLDGTFMMTENAKTLKPGSPSDPTAIIQTNGFTAQTGSWVMLNIDGTTPGTQFDQIIVNGTVDISNANLFITPTYTAATDEELVIIDNDGTDPIIGKFFDRPEGSIISVYNGETDTTYHYYITYQGGDGNDVVLYTNHTPSVNAVNLNAQEDGPTVDGNFDGSDTDPGQTITYTITDTTGLTEGSVINNNDGTFTFDPGSDFQDLALGQTRDVTFEYTATDDQGVSSTPATVTITVTGTNDLPQAFASASSTNEDTPVTGVFSGGDVDTNDSLTYVLVTQPSQGTVTNFGNFDARKATFTFDPGNDFQDLAQGESRLVSFTYKVIDNHSGESNVANFNMTVVGVNDTPTASDISESTDEQTPVTANFAGNDVDTSDTLTYSIVDDSGITGGTLTNNNDGTFTFNPDDDFLYLGQGESEQVSFTYKATDNHAGDSETKTVTITINGINQAPTAGNLAINATEDGPAVVDNFDGADGDTNDTITYQLVDLPANGTVINNNDGTFSYTAGDLPNLNDGETKQVTFTYKAIDNHGEESELATVTVTISGVTETPVGPNTYPNGAVDDAYTTSDVAIDIDAIANDTDPDGDTLHIHSVDLTSNLGATVSLNPDGTIHYEPGSVFDSDTPGDVILDFFRYELQDSYGNIDITRVNVRVTVVDAVNDAPVAQNVSGNAVEDGPAVTIGFNADDQDSDDNPSTLTYSIVSSPAVGSVINNGDGTFSYTAGDLPDLDTGENQQVTFTYKATDSHGLDSNVATVTITIAGLDEDNPDNDAPVAQNVTGNVSEDGPAVNVSFNADDVDSDDDPTTLVYTITSTPANGVLINNGDGTFSFDPDGDFESLTLGQSQNVVFTYIATDSHGVDSNTATVTLTVIGANETTPVDNQYPNGAVDSTSTQADVAIDIDVLDNDSDPDGDSLTVQSVETPTSDAGVPLTINPDGTIAYDPTGHFDHLAPGEVYRDTFRYTLVDPYGYADTTRVFVYVTGVDSSTPNVAPTAGNVTGSTSEDLSITLNFNGADADDLLTNLTYNVTSSPAGGSVTNNGNGTFTFNPGSDFQSLNNGDTDQVTFTYQVVDPHGETSNTATVTITINGSDESSGGNTAPIAQNVVGNATEDAGSVTINFNADDVDGDDDPTTLTYTILSSPSEGSVISNGDGTFTFNPGSGFQDLGVGQTRQVSFTYKVTDSHAEDSNTATVTITVTGANDYPTGVPNLTQTTVDQAIDIDVLSNDFDIDGDTLSTASVDAVSELGVSLSINPDGTIHYDPSSALASLPQGTTVRDSFRYNLTDPYGNQDRTRVFIDVTAESITIVPLTAGLGSLASTAPSSLANTGVFGSDGHGVSSAALAWVNHQASLKPTAPAMRLASNFSLSQGDDDSDSDNQLKLILVSEDVEME